MLLTVRAIIEVHLLLFHRISTHEFMMNLAQVIHPPIEKNR